MTLRTHYATWERHRWMDLLAHSSAARLSMLLEEIGLQPGYERLELKQVRAPTASTRCLVRLASGTTGRACLAGRRPRHAELAALFDALLCEPEHYDELIFTVIESLANEVSTVRIPASTEMAAPTAARTRTLLA